MNTTNRTLDLLAKKHGITSDYGLGKLLEVSRNTISNYRHERSSFSDSTAIKAAELLGDDPGELMAQLQAERADSEETAAMWKRIAVRLRHAAAVGVIGIAGIIGFFSPTPSQAATQANSPSMYIMTN